MPDTQTVGELAAQSLAAVRVFEKYGIDYCCGGKQPLADACRDKGYDAESVRNELAAAIAGPVPSGADWHTAPLADLIRHIVATHHEYLKRELPAVQTRLEKVYRIYNERYGPTLVGLPDVFNALKTELEAHLMKEERILFPAIAGMEAAAQSGGPAPANHCGSVSNPIRVMEAEHESAGSALAAIHRITGDFSVPEYGCATYRALMSGLSELERDLHLHIHLENNVLFPRAEELEKSQR